MPTASPPTTSRSTSGIIIYTRSTIAVGRIFFGAAARDDISGC
jgi:hypothetical protein